MTTVPIPLDRIFLDDLAICPRSSLLHVGPGDRPELRASPWWVYMASARLPNDLGNACCKVGFRGAAAGGREMSGDVQIVGRLDDAYGTELILSGLHPLETDSASDPRPS
ncbi:MAG: hypothetical protein ABIZ57_00335 [Candidatus Limnocylindria bacterium]